MTADFLTFALLAAVLFVAAVIAGFTVCSIWDWRTERKIRRQEVRDMVAAFHAHKNDRPE